MTRKPVLAILLGDASGIGPELVAKLAVHGFYNEYCTPIILGDNRIFEAGLSTFGGSIEHYTISDVSECGKHDGIAVLDTKDQDPALFEMKKTSAYCGKACVDTIRNACELCKQHKIDGFVFGPFNKAALKEGGCKFESEHYLMADIFGVTGPFGEINMLDGLMTVRTTSHIPMEEVSSHLTVDRILRAIELGYITVKNTGVEAPRIGVAAYNPHCGENGACGHEEIDVIAPAVKLAVNKGWNVTGPYSSDILFYRAFNGDFDAVVTMYHDQGQIALKLKGFERGVTIAGGQPYPIVTCAHGVAYGKAGEGRASTTAFENAVKVASKMCATGATIFERKTPAAS